MEKVVLTSAIVNSTRDWLERWLDGYLISITVEEGAEPDEGRRLDRTASYPKVWAVTNHPVGSVGVVLRTVNYVTGRDARHYRFTSYTRKNAVFEKSEDGETVTVIHYRDEDDDAPIKTVIWRGELIPA